MKIYVVFFLYPLYIHIIYTGAHWRFSLKGGELFARLNALIYLVHPLSVVVHRTKNLQILSSTKSRLGGVFHPTPCSFFLNNLKTADNRTLNLLHFLNFIVVNKFCQNFFYAFQKNQKWLIFFYQLRYRANIYIFEKDV